MFASDAIVLLHEATLGAMRDLDRLAAHTLCESARKKQARRARRRRARHRGRHAGARHENRGGRYQLVGFAALGSMVEIAMRALVGSYPAFGREIRPTDSEEVRSAAAVVDLCGRLLTAIDHHRRLVAGQQPVRDRRWPF